MIQTNESEVVNIEDKFKYDKQYIENSILCLQPNGNLMKFSPILNAVTVMNETTYDFVRYWCSRYKTDNYYKNKIEEVCKDKLENGLISTQKMIEKVKHSKDIEKEKDKAIRYLTCATEQ